MKRKNKATRTVEREQPEPGFTWAKTVNGNGRPTWRLTVARSKA